MGMFYGQVGLAEGSGAPRAGLAGTGREDQPCVCASIRILHASMIVGTAVHNRSFDSLGFISWENQTRISHIN